MRLPIHHCSSIEILEEFPAFGAHATNVEPRGVKTYGISMRQAENTRLIGCFFLFFFFFFFFLFFFGSIAQRYPLETGEALLTRSEDGYTPIRLVLKAKESSRSRKKCE